MTRVIIESPYAAKTFFGRWLNKRYAQRCMVDSLMRGESPFASHLLYTQVLDDRDAQARWLGISSGFEWGEVADKAAVYTDRGISGGMRKGIERHKENGVPIEYRSLGGAMVGTDITDRPLPIADVVAMPKRRPF